MMVSQIVCGGLIGASMILFFLIGVIEVIPYNNAALAWTCCVAITGIVSGLISLIQTDFAEK